MIFLQDNLPPTTSELLDFTFIYEELMDKYCPNNGCTVESPVRMFKYLLLKTIYNILDVIVVECSLHYMSFRYFLAMALEDEVSNALHCPSSESFV